MCLRYIVCGTWEDTHEMVKCYRIYLWDEASVVIAVDIPTDQCSITFYFHVGW